MLFGSVHLQTSSLFRLCLLISLISQRLFLKDLKLTFIHHSIIFSHREIETPQTLSHVLATKNYGTAWKAHPRNNSFLIRVFHQTPEEQCTPDQLVFTLREHRFIFQPFKHDLNMFCPVCQNHYHDFNPDYPRH